MTMKCPACGGPMKYCRKGHPHRRLPLFTKRKFKESYRGEKDPHHVCLEPSHGVVEVFKDGEVVEI